MKLKQSPLYEKYIELNAKLVEFAGWEMPISFSGLVEEHESVRNSIGFFDISHMGVISLRGINLKEHIQKFFPTNIFSINKGQSCYSFFLNQNAGIIDDLIIYDLGLQENHYSEIFLIVNASRYEKDFDWLKQNLKDEPIELNNAKKGKALFAIQGKNTFRFFEEWSGHSVNHLKNFGCEYKEIDKFLNSGKIFFSKTGYTGENGMEILLPKNLAFDLWDFLISKNINPCGLGARDTLRLEAGLPLYGQDFDEKITPYEAGFGWVINLENDHEFFGRKSLETIGANQIEKKLVGIKILGKAIARKNCEIFKDGKIIGQITSGSWSPTLKKPIALGYVKINYSNLNEEVEVKIRNKFFKGIISKKAFYKKDF